MIKRISALFLTGIIVLVFSGISFGGDYTYTTTAFQTLEEGNAYSWGIDLGSNFKYAIDSGETISSFTLMFDNIKENTNNDIFYVSVLDQNTYGGNIGKKTYDDDNITGNYFNSNAAKLFTLEDVPDYNRDISVTYNSDKSFEYIIKKRSTILTDTTDPDVAANASIPLTTTSINVIADLNTYISNNILLLSFDPDCHYNTQSISLTLSTATASTPSISPDTVPEPETLVLFGLGLLCVSAFGRKRFSSMG
ncbi:PEP-CTERM sorting domain-containing protein [Desulfobacter postgatei]|uniref:PEP-CTERM sorting domain-containing protein n=1 Tax=Desulfobacter postgatei TaxID=2293 RepID=UPI00259BAC31|nr:PEP-CTERM sorting domain-containing protein [uncultured Desulfobacter sp.]